MEAAHNANSFNTSSSACSVSLDLQNPCIFGLPGFEIIHSICKNLPKTFLTSAAQTFVSINGDSSLLWSTLH